MIFHSQPWIVEQDMDSVKTVLDSAMLSRGEITTEFENVAAQYLNKKHALFTGNGTQAQILLLKAIGVQAGDEVIIPTYVCNKVLKGIQAIQAIPVLCDVESHGNMTANTVASRITSRTKAIVLVHIFGRNAWTNEIKGLGFPVIEDICQSFGHLDYSKRTGTQSDYAFTSFHGTKCLPAGEGGMLFVNDDELFDRIIYFKQSLGYITSGTDIISALLSSQFSRYNSVLANRLAIATLYNQNIDSRLTTTEKAAFHSNMHYRYVLTSQGNWETIREQYLAHGIHVRKGVDDLLHRQLGASDSEFPNAKAVFDTSISIPILPQLSPSQVNHIVQITNELAKNGIL